MQQSIFDSVEANPSSQSSPDVEGSCRERLIALLSQDLDFHGQDSQYGSHDFHAFPAKFPPQLPHKFIHGLTETGDTVLDPMMGSGTAVLEAFRAERRAIGFDIDPLARLIAAVKVTPLNRNKAYQAGKRALKEARSSLSDHSEALEGEFEQRWDGRTRKFVNYWFARETQLELIALKREIEKIGDSPIRRFLELVFSGVIITKSGGVSMALDLAHTRPHRAKTVTNTSGEIVLDVDASHISDKRRKILNKTLRSPLHEFEKQFHQKLEDIPGSDEYKFPPEIREGNAESLPLDESSVDLIVTSPPYAANAIDYMRAHKFSLVWMGHPVKALGQKRKTYIGGEAVTGIDYETLPERTEQIVQAVSEKDEKKGRVLHRYYSEMTRVLCEMRRVLRPGAAAVLVVGSSTMRGQNTETGPCLAEIGCSVGFEVPKIGVRNLDRNKRMMPAGAKKNTDSQIQQRMHEEYVIGFYKPEG